MDKYRTKMNSLYFYFFKDDREKFATTENVRQVEQQLDLILPDEYKEFVVNYGLSAFSEGYVYFTIQGNCPGGNRGILDVFFGVYPDSAYDLLDNYDGYRGRMPSHLFPIAGDPGANIICMSLGKKDTGRIYFWDHEEEIIEEDEADDSNLYLIANSFEEFINSLEIELHEAIDN